MRNRAREARVDSCSCFLGPSASASFTISCRASLLAAYGSSKDLRSYGSRAGLPRRHCLRRTHHGALRWSVCRPANASSQGRDDTTHLKNFQSVASSPVWIRKDGKQTKLTRVTLYWIAKRGGADARACYLPSFPCLTATNRRRTASSRDLLGTRHRRACP